MKREKTKQSIYMSSEMLAELKTEVIRLERSYSWLIQRAWRIAREQVSAYPAEKELDQGAEQQPGGAR